MSDVFHTLDSGLHVTFGCEPRVCSVGDGSFDVFADDWLVPEPEWQERIAKGEGDLSYGVTWILDQNPRGWCWTFAGAQTVMVDRKIDGHKPELLLPDVAGIYLRQPSGYPIDGTLKNFVLPVGYPPASACTDKSVDPLKYGARLSSLSQLESNWKEQAAVRKSKRWLDCPTKQHVVSAVLLGHPVEIGTFWEMNLHKGHALCVVKVEWFGGECCLVGPNSWGVKSFGWGDYPGKPGWFRVPLRQWAVETFGAWCLVDEGWTPDDKAAPAPKS